MELNRQIQSLNPKAYLISLCLCAQKVLAENTGEEAAVEEKAFIDQVLEAVKNPSADHMQVYTGMVLILAIIGFIVMTALKKDEVVKVSLDDIASDKPRKRAGVKKHADAPAAAKPAAAAKPNTAEWEDCKIDSEGL